MNKEYRYTVAFWNDAVWLSHIFEGTEAKCEQAIKAYADKNKMKSEIISGTEMSKLKVYGGCFDGKNRLIVAAKSKAEAGRLFGVSATTMNTYCSETGNDNELKIALSNPGVVYKTNANYNPTQTYEEQK